MLYEINNSTVKFMNIFSQGETLLISDENEKWRWLF